MNTKTTLYLIICTVACYILIGCKSEKNNDSALIRFNVSAFYPEKEIKLEDVVTIEYLQLEVDKEFLFRESPKIITSKKIIFGRNDGDILIFSRDGKPLSKFNRRGNGPEEYPNVGRILYDEASDEIFVVTSTKTMVYSSAGAFKRIIPHLGDRRINMVVNFDSETLLIYDENDLYPAPFSLISKKDGSVVEKIEIPTGQKVNFMIRPMREGGMTFVFPKWPVTWHGDGFILTEHSIDTVYVFSHERKLLPALVRTPEIHSMDPMVALYGFIEAGKYEFLHLHRLISNSSNDFPTPTYLMRDKQTGSVYRQKITFNEYRGKQVTLSAETTVNTQNAKVGLIILGLEELRKANSENMISGRLKELVVNSEDDGNDIYMLLHFK